MCRCVQVTANARRAHQSIRSPTAGVTGGCEPPNMGFGNQQLLNAEPSISPVPL